MRHKIDVPEWMRAEAEEVVAELEEATARYGPLNSGHEGLAVLREEYLELEKEIFWGLKKVSFATDPSYAHRACIRDEAKQVAAMAIRIMIDLT